MKHVHKFLATIAAVLTLMSESQASDRPIVVELFTSQGCSSCPPADRILGQLATQPDIVALSFHVDYWNYIGWTDPFSAPEYSTRQRNYARIMGLRHVYTPQIVVQGTAEVVGSNRLAVDSAIQEASKLERVDVTLSRLPNGGVHVELPNAPLSGGDTMEVVLFVFDRKHETAVQRGENGGRTLVNTHVVRELHPLGQWSGKARSYDAPALVSGSDRGCAVVVQSVTTGKIYGAAQMLISDGA